MEINVVSLDDAANQARQSTKAGTSHVNLGYPTDWFHTRLCKPGMKMSLVKWAKNSNVSQLDNFGWREVFGEMLFLFQVKQCTEMSHLTNFREGKTKKLSTKHNNTYKSKESN